MTMESPDINMQEAEAKKVVEGYFSLKRLVIWFFRAHPILASGLSVLVTSTTIIVGARSGGMELMAGPFGHKQKTELVDTMRAVLPGLIEASMDRALANQVEPLRETLNHDQKLRVILAQIDSNHAKHHRMDSLATYQDSLNDAAWASLTGHRRSAIQ